MLETVSGQNRKADPAPRMNWENVTTGQNFYVVYIRNSSQQIFALNNTIDVSKMCLPIPISYLRLSSISSKKDELSQETSTKDELRLVFIEPSNSGGVKSTTTGPKICR